MDEADIFLLLLTPGFIASEYITSKEIIKAYEKYKNEQSKIFPVICDSVDWKLLPITKSEKEFHPVLKRDMYVWLGKFQPFPKDGKPIKNWKNENDGLLDVIEKLKKEIMNS